ncbi:MAG TPA: sugar ABC transporter substrate-binding protein [Thermoflexales bacterium]|nr:sugar ABC transporter substrate-binding protein [Thermoflexales bacterium]HQZ98840.1 sugar ABC transporter substrate-binding protein [Thermoflexales bacterium]
MNPNKSKYLLALPALAMLVSACGAPAAAPTAAPAAPTAAPAAKATDVPAAPKATDVPKPAATAAPAANAVTIRYTLWDSNQLPAYQACADAFMKKTPNIVVKVEQKGWDDYWTGLNTGFASGDAPDVFTDHLAKYPEFVSKNLILDIEPFVQADKVDTKQYLGALADLWMKSGKRFGLPKDWDTVSVMYNADMLKKAGIDPAIMKDWTWNPKDGGQYGEVIAKLTLDKNGKNGLDPAFDKKNVVQYGFSIGAGGFAGQTEWSHYAASNGFKLTDGPWTTKYYYDDPKLAETIQWLADLSLAKGFAPGIADVKSLGNSTLFQSGKVAMTTDGSWMIGDYVKNSKFTVGFGLLPKGPIGGRRSMFNGLADSIWVGTKHPQEAWQWLKYASSEECEKTVGTFGVVFPAIKSGVDEALKVYKSKGLDVTSFTDLAFDSSSTFLFPITDHGSDVSSIMDATMDSIFLGQKKAADALKDANTKVNALFK